MNICVTGAAGFLGAHLCERLKADGHNVFGVDNLLGGEVANVRSTTFVQADCTDFAKMLDLLRGQEVVYHCAAAPHEGLSVFSPALVTHHTYQSSVAVGSAAVACGVKRVVFLSSMARYGHGEGKLECFNMIDNATNKVVGEMKRVAFAPFTEAMPANPVDPYGIAKVAAEQVLTCLGRTHGMEVVTAVPHNIYGPLQRYYDPYRNVVGIFVNRMLQGKQPIIYGDGSQQRCFSYVGDCIDPLVKMGLQPGLDGEVINIGPDEGAVTVLHLANYLATILGFDLKPLFLPDRPCEVKTAWPSSDKARRLLGYEAKTTLLKGLAEMVRWVKERGAREFLYHLPLEIISDKTPTSWKERLM